jgi:aspartate-semialdehyde dehydrogenase
MTLEQGKPLSESRGEIDHAASFVEWFAEEAKRIDGEIPASHLPGRRMSVRREPLGVAAAVTPWNFPSAMITRKAAAALAAGCTMVVRPASETPFSALALAELGERAGIPAGVFSVVTGAPEPIVGEMCANATVRAVSFTGSTEIGKKLLRQGADTVKRMSMELGGHAPFIAFPDVDVDEAVQAALDAKFQTTGQDCLAANRIFVHADIYDEFLRRFAERVSALRVGGGFDAGVEDRPADAPARRGKMPGACRGRAGQRRQTPRGRQTPRPRRALLRADTARRRRRDDGDFPGRNLWAGRRSRPLRH